MRAIRYSLREAFIAENPAGLPEADLAIVASWDHRKLGVTGY